MKLMQIYEEVTGEYIGYHGTREKFARFDLERAPQKILWFSSSIDKVKRGEVGALTSGYIAKVKLTIKNPANWDEYDKKSLWELQSDGYDGGILPDGDEVTYFVFSPDQVKIISWTKI